MLDLVRRAIAVSLSVICLLVGALFVFVGWTAGGRNLAFVPPGAAFCVLGLSMLVDAVRADG